MKFFLSATASRSLLAACLLAALASASCNRVDRDDSPPANHGDFVKIPCADVQVDVDPAKLHGVVQDVVYLCGNKKISWIKHDHKVQIHFDNSPFTDGKTDFDDDQTAVIAAPSYALAPKSITVYKYTITVDGKSFDPHIIGGGGVP